MCKRAILILVYLFYSITLLFAQSDKTAQLLELILLQIIGQEEKDAIRERLTYWATYPLDINSASAEELSMLPLLDDFFLRNLLVERSRRGSFHSIYQLKEVQGAPLESLSLLEPFITTIPKEERTNRPLQQELYLGFDTEWTGYERPYPKSPRWALLYEAEKERSRKGRRDGWSYYLIAEKDIGEPWLPFRQGVADHLSTAFSYRNQKGVQIVIGDYRVTHGLGLLMGQSHFFLSKLSATMEPPSRMLRTIRPHRSFREYGFLRGVAAQFALSRWLSMVSYVGYEKVDALIEDQSIRTLYQTGMHRTEQERRERHQAVRGLIGSSIAFDKNDLHFALNAILYHHRTSQKPAYTLYPPPRYPQALRLKATSMDFHYLGPTWKIYGEWLINEKERMALQSGLTLWDETWGQLSITGRYLGENQVTPYGVSDSYFSSNSNEKGLQLAWRGELARYWSAALYLDHFYKLYPVDDIGTGANTHIVADAKYYSDRTQFHGRARYLKISNRPNRYSLRLSFYHNITKAWHLRLRGDLAHVTGEPLAYDVATRVRYLPPDNHHWRGEVGLQYFYLAGSSATIQSDNPFIPFHYYQAPLRGHGWRTTLLLRFQPHRHLAVNLRMGHNFYTRLPDTPLPSLVEITLYYHL